MSHETEHKSFGEPDEAGCSPGKPPGRPGGGP